MPSPKGKRRSEGNEPRKRDVRSSDVKPAARAPARLVSRPRQALPPTSQLTSLAAWLAFAEQVYEAGDVALGQIATSAHDEALYLLLRTLDWPLDSGSEVLHRPITPAQRIALRRVLEKRVIERTPAAYLTREAFLGDYRFYVDERVIIPRSYFLELVPDALTPWLPHPKKVRNAVDVCTGSGCLAILLAHAYPQAKVDGIDLSPDALQVARINVAEHSLEKRVTLHRSNVFAQVPTPAGGYDLILSNPPYEPSAHCDALPVEFTREPRMALDGGVDGLDIIRRLVEQARDRLSPRGILTIEVGGLREAMDREFGALEPVWLDTQDGSNCICVIGAKALQKRPS